MIRRAFLWAAFLLAGAASAASAATIPNPQPTSALAGMATKPPLPGLGGPPTIPYDKFSDTATPQRGLFTVWRYNGSTMLELRKDQFDKDYAELSVPVNGIGAVLFSGITDLAPVRIIRFVRQDNKVAILFPSTRLLADAGTPVANAVAAGTAPTVVGVANVISVDDKTGNVVFDASSLLDDVTDIADVLSDIDGGMRNPMGSYRLDRQQSYFSTTKAFPENVVLNVNQTFSSMQPSADVLSVSPDARNIQMTVQYNIAEIPEDQSYMPRLYDDRVGYFVNAHQDFSRDDSVDNGRYYIVRFNVQKTDPTAPVSPAKKPIVYYLSNTIPMEYRDPIRRALLTWNKAFEKLGITDAVEVKDQPDDPTWDPDDIRYNVVRWLAEIEGGFAEAQLLYNPYTGEMIKSGIVVDSDLMRYGKFDYPVIIQPNADGTASPRHRELADGAEFAAESRENYAFGATALTLQSGANYHVPQKYADDFLLSIVLHESGHDFGLRHNFIGSEAYTAKELQSASFTAKYGVASSVMEYSPINIWPKGTPQGAYFQTVLGPYDYYVIRWGYETIPGARTPDQELPALRALASSWTQPDRAFLSDEDVDWFSGAGVDPRNQQWDLTDDNIAWCQTQMTMARNLIAGADHRFPAPETSFDDLRSAFGSIVGQYGRCSQIVSRYLGGEYVSRSLRGDPHAKLPLTAIPIATQKRAFAVLQNGVFSANAWNFSPVLLRQLVTQYRYDDWIGNLPDRHDISVVALINRYQMAVVSRLYTPVTLARLDDIDLKYSPGTTMDISDLYAWMQSAVYGDVASGRAIPLVSRNLQRSYTATLSHLANAPAPGAPADAQSLASYELRALHDSIGSALRGGVGDLMTRAHLEAMDDDVQRALDAHYVIAMPRS